MILGVPPPPTMFYGEPGTDVMGQLEVGGKRLLDAFIPFHGRAVHMKANSGYDEIIDQTVVVGAHRGRLYFADELDSFAAEMLFASAMKADEIHVEWELVEDGALSVMGDFSLYPQTRDVVGLDEEKVDICSEIKKRCLLSRNGRVIVYIGTYVPELFSTPLVTELMESMKSVYISRVGHGFCPLGDVLTEMSDPVKPYLGSKQNNDLDVKNMRLVVAPIRSFGQNHAALRRFKFGDIGRFK